MNTAGKSRKSAFFYSILIGCGVGFVCYFGLTLENQLVRIRSFLHARTTAQQSAEAPQTESSQAENTSAQSVKILAPAPVSKSAQSPAVAADSTPKPTAESVPESTPEATENASENLPESLPEAVAGDILENIQPEPAQPLPQTDTEPTAIAELPPLDETVPSTETAANTEKPAADPVSEALTQELPPLESAESAKTAESTNTKPADEPALDSELPPAQPAPTATAQSSELPDLPELPGLDEAPAPTPAADTVAKTEPKPAKTEPKPEETASKPEPDIFVIEATELIEPVAETQLADLLPVLTDKEPTPATPEPALAAASVPAVSEPASPAIGNLAQAPDSTATPSASPRENTALQTHAPLTIDVTKQDIRVLLSVIQQHSDVRIYATPDVQGRINCKADSQDVDEIFHRLLGATSFDFRREDHFIYVARRGEMTDLPSPLSKTTREEFTPRFVPATLLCKALEPNLSPYGHCEVSPEGDVVVEDLELALRDLRQIVQVLDVPGKTPKLDFFAFQRYIAAPKDMQDLKELADPRDILLQEITVSELNPQTLQPLNPPGKEPEKEKKEKLPKLSFAKHVNETEWHAYTLSHRIDTMLIALEDQRDIRLITPREAPSSTIQLDKPMSFPFHHQLSEGKTTDYTLTVTPRKAKTEEQAAGMMDFIVECRPKTADKKHPTFCAQATLDMDNALILQLPLVEFKKVLTDEEKKKPFAPLKSTTTLCETFLILVPHMEEPPRRETELSSAALKFLSKQMETQALELSKKATDDEEKATAAALQSLAQRVRNLVYDVKIQ